jgi:hypothetical protein
MGCCLLVDPTGRSFFLKGDDIIAYWTSSQWELYLDLMRCAGYKINLKKTFFSDTASTPLGWFCEKGYTLQVSERLRTNSVRLALVEMSDIISLRFLTKATVDETGTPPWVSMVRNISAVTNKVTKHAFLRLHNLVMKTVPKWYRSEVYDPRLPLEFGGLGLISKKRWQTPLPAKSAGAYQRITNGDLAPLVVEDFRPSSLAMEETRKVLRPLYDLPLVNFMSTDRKVIPREAISQYSTRIYEAKVLKGVPTTVINRRPHNVRKKLRAFRGRNLANHTITYRDAYDLTSRLGVLLPAQVPVPLPEGYWTISNADPMVVPSSFFSNDALNTVQ